MASYQAERQSGTPHRAVRRNCSYVTACGPLLHVYFSVHTLQGAKMRRVISIADVILSAIPLGESCPEWVWASRRPSCPRHFSCPFVLGAPLCRNTRMCSFITFYVSQLYLVLHEITKLPTSEELRNGCQSLGQHANMCTDDQGLREKNRGKAL